MNEIFKGLLFLHGYPLPFESVEGSRGEAEDGKFAGGYGNRVASRRVFAPLGRARRQRADAQAPAREVCVAGGCR